MVFSGRGIQVKWILCEALPLAGMTKWKGVQQEIGARLKCIGADANAVDSSRVFRIVGTIHSGSGEEVRTIHSNGIAYNFEDFARSLLPNPTAVVLSVISSEIESVEPVRGGSCLDSNDLLTEATAKLKKRPKGHLVLASDGAQKSKMNTGHRIFIPSRLAWDRIADLKLLARLRGYTAERGGVADGGRGRIHLVIGRGLSCRHADDVHCSLDTG